MATNVHKSPNSETPLQQKTMPDLSVVRRSWRGVRIEVEEYRNSNKGEVLLQLPHTNETRLNVLLEDLESCVEGRLKASQPCRTPFTPRHMHYAPAGSELWCYSPKVSYIRSATLIFDLPEIIKKSYLDVDPSALITPRLRYSDERIWPLVKMLADVVNNQDPSVQLYGESLATAIAACLFAKPTEAAKEPKGLASWQLKRVVDYMHAHFPQRIELGYLSAMVGLSQAHFSRAFKASTGLAPYRWQLDMRIRRAQELLLNTSASLDQIADVTGFADAAHFGRTFRNYIGTTPTSWRHNHKI